MEPRPHERGNVESGEVAEEMAACFNGATSSRTWKPVSTGTGISGLTTLQWSHALTNVETTTARTRSRPYRSASMEPRPHERGNYYGKDEEQAVQKCFNGATSSRTWKPMVAGHHPTAAGCFNGATSSRTWKRRRPPRKGAAKQCFNGATSSRTWKLSRCPLDLQRRFGLQWSHVLTNVETRP